MANLKKDHVYQSIRNDIDNGILQEGDRLLPEREFSKKLGVSMSTLRTALRQLEQEGFIKRIRSQGTFIAKPYASYDALNCGRIACITRAKGKAKETDILNMTIQNGILRNGYQVIQPPCALSLKQHKLNENSIDLIKSNIRQLQNIVDGFIIDERVPEHVLSHFIGSDLKPMVIVGRQTNLPINHVVFDDKAGIKQLLTMTEKLNYKKYIICKIDRSQADIDRFNAAKEILRNNNPVIIDGWMNETLDVFLKKINHALKNAEKEKCCILAFNNSLAEFVAKHLKKQKHKIGKNVGIAGYMGNNEKNKKHKMTTLSVDYEKLGKSAVQTLFEQIQTGPYMEAKKHFVDVDLNLGETI